MNKFFPLPLLAIIIGCFLTFAYFTFAYAQQHDSPASAQKLDADHPISLTLPAYATEYFYFSLPNAEDNIPSITLSDSSGIGIQIYDSREATLKYSISSAHVITFHYALSTGERYFLKLDNLSSQDKKLNATLRYTAKAKKSANTKKSKKAKKVKKQKSSVIQNNSVKHVKFKKQKDSPKERSSAKQKSSVKYVNSKKQKNSLKQKSSITQNNSVKHVNSAKQKSPLKQNRSANIRSSMTPAPSQKSKSKLQKSTITMHTPKPTTTDPNSKSDFLLSTHFLRIKAGTSLAIPEALNLPEKASSLSYQPIFSDRISIQNGILYARSHGIAVIGITGKDFKSSCTVYIQ